MRPLRALPICCLLLVALAFPVFSAEEARPAAPEKQKIGIMKFDASKNVDPAVAQFVYDCFMEQMVKLGRYTVVDWQELERVQKYIADSQPNITDEAAKKQAMMKQLGIERLYLGSIVLLESTHYVTAKVIALDLTVEKVEKGSASSAAELPQCVADVAFRLTATPEELAKRAAQPAKQEEKPPAKPKELPGLPGWTSEARRVRVAAADKETEKEITYYTNTLGMKLVPIPGGEFMMGSHVPAGVVAREVGGESSYYTRELPLHKVKISRSFYMGAYEVTNGQCRKFKPGHDSGNEDGATLNGDDQPAVNVSWDDARTFCEWLSRKEGLTYRLPTEAEWEYACRAGSTGHFYWGENPGLATQYANTDGNEDGHKVTAPVGSFPPNPFGLYDMAGNVQEWCRDWYATLVLRNHGAFIRFQARTCRSGAGTGMRRAIIRVAQQMTPKDRHPASIV